MKTPFHRAILKHWKAHRPQMVKSLESKGLLHQAVNHAAERTVAAESSLIQNGVSAPQAQEKMREEWAFLPSEAEVPDLPNGSPEAWLARATSSSPPEASSPAAASEPG